MNALKENNGTYFDEIAILGLGSSPYSCRMTIEDEPLMELKQTIESVGLITPLLVRVLEQPRIEKNSIFLSYNREVQYEIVCGERRYRAVASLATSLHKVDETKIPCMVREMTDDEAMCSCLVENMQRVDLTPIEMAIFFQKYIDMYGKPAIKELAGRCGVSERFIYRKLNLLNAPVEIKELIKRGTLTQTQFEKLQKVPSEQKAIEIAKEAAEWRTSKTNWLDNRIKKEFQEVHSAKTESIPIDWRRRYEDERRTRIDLQETVHEQDERIKKLIRRIQELEEENELLKGELQKGSADN